jgi:hypothetical protein
MIPAPAVNFAAVMSSKCCVAVRHGMNGSRSDGFSGPDSYLTP